jgi:hypothetical protein
VGTAEGIEVAPVDVAAWEEAMSRFGKRPSSSAPKRPNPLASLSLHARRLLSPDDKNRDSLE